jgi:plasmid stabilization system protein ParE
MPKKIIWSLEAESDYSANIDYLLEKWSVRDAREFVENAESVIKIISNFPEAFSVSDYKKIRKALICNQINLLYQVHKSEIILLRFLDNRQKPLSKKI